MRTILLTLGQVATVDDSDFEIVRDHKWFAWKFRNLYYPIRNLRTGEPGFPGTLRLAHTLLPSAEIVVYRDRNPLNCCRDNLIAATRLMAQRRLLKRHKPSSSKYKGVCWDTRREKWLARITADRQITLGRFDSEEDAARAYDQGVRDYWGGNGVFNFPSITES